MDTSCRLHPAEADEYELKQIEAFSRDFSEMLAHLTHIDAYDYVNDKRLQKALEYIEKNYQQTIIQSEVAELIGLTPSQLAKLLREQTHMTFTEILNEVRVAHAATLICETNDSIELIAFDCGFGTGRTFTREFRQFTGFTPADFRDMYKKIMQAGSFARPFIPPVTGEKTRNSHNDERGGYRNAGNELCHYRSMVLVN